MSFSAAASFCHRFGTGLHAGADMVKLLESECRIGSSQQKDAIKKLVAGVKQGEQLHVLMGTSFSQIDDNHGELENQLGRNTCFPSHEHYTRQQQLRRKFLGAIAYPAFMLTFSIGVVSLLIYLMGILTPAGGGQMTDLLGWGLRGGSGVLIFWTYLLFFFAIAAGAVFCFFRNVAGVQNIVPLIYLIPRLGDAIQTITIARFCRVLSVGLGAGLEPIPSIALALDATDSDYYRAVQDETESAILNGATLASALEKTNIFPDDFIGKIEIAEHSGTDSESIAFLAEDYDERAQTVRRSFTHHIRRGCHLGCLVRAVRDVPYHVGCTGFIRKHSNPFELPVSPSECVHHGLNASRTVNRRLLVLR